jgi:Tfp pilus assembly protein PilN
MINLLPPEERRQLAASRINTLLLRYNFVMIGVLAFVGLAIGFTYVYLTNTQATAEHQIAENQSRVSNYSQVEQQEKQFKANLATAKQILDKEVVYTKAILGIANLIPNGVILQSLSLNAQTFGTETTLLFQAKTIDDALNLKNVLEKSDLFTNVHFQNIDATTGSADHPVSVGLNVTINKNIAVNEVKK